MRRLIILILISALSQFGVADIDLNLDPLIEVSTSQGAVTTNEGIPADIQAEIEEMNSILIDKIIAGDSAYVESITHPENTNSVDFEYFMSIYSENITKDSKIDILDEYYFTIEAQGDSSNTMAVSDDGNYIISTKAVNGEISISFLIIEQENKQLLLTVEYIRDNANWYIRTLHLNVYTYYGLTPQHYYETANICNEEERYLSAFLIMYGCYDAIRPSPLMQYSNESEIYVLTDDLDTYFSQNYPFPIEFEDLPSVTVYGIDLKHITEGLMPDFMYVTGLDIDDKSESNLQAIEDEANALHEKMMEHFPGIEDDFNIFLYGASSQMPPDAVTYYDRYGTIVVMD